MPCDFDLQWKRKMELLEFAVKKKIIYQVTTQFLSKKEPCYKVVFDFDGKVIVPSITFYPKTAMEARELDQKGHDAIARRAAGGKVTSGLKSMQEVESENVQKL